jgi:hypothetical protein
MPVVSDIEVCEFGESLLIGADEARLVATQVSLLEPVLLVGPDRGVLSHRLAIQAGEVLVEAAQPGVGAHRLFDERGGLGAVERCRMAEAGSQGDPQEYTQKGQGRLEQGGARAAQAGSSRRGQGGGHGSVRGLRPILPGSRECRLSPVACPLPFVTFDRLNLHSRLE